MWMNILHPSVVTLRIPDDSEYETLRASGFLIAKGITNIDLTPPDLVEHFVKNGMKVYDLVDLPVAPIAANDDVF
jgi:hypothetical protein